MSRTVDVLLVTPPLLEPASPYPATAYLAGFLAARGIPVTQLDLSIAWTRRIFSRAFLLEIQATVQACVERNAVVHPAVPFFLEAFEAYARVIDPVMSFLAGQDPVLAHRIASRRWCPEGPRFSELAAQPDLLRDAFGARAIHDRAKYLASRFIGDIADVITAAVDPEFRLWSYGEALVGGSFDPLARRLAGAPGLLDRELEALWVPVLQAQRPALVAITVPFPGNCYAALRLAAIAKRVLPGVHVALGGGFAGNQLRQLGEPRVFDQVDFVVLDDGEAPLARIVAHLSRDLPREALHRTWVRDAGVPRYLVQPDIADVPQGDVGYPTYATLPLDQYFSMFASPNPMERLWCDLRWHKLTLAHGCYWKRCAFCDTELDYIRRYEAAPVDLVLGRMQRIAQETGRTGFHFVDEAAPPKLLGGLSRALLERGLSFTWFTNIRFDKAFGPELTGLMARAGCVGVSGGLEVASDRLLSLMDKGITVEQAARVCRDLTRSGILVHAYLMYGFPTQTEQETVDSLERVRQLFRLGWLHSGYWHKFTTTAHSPVARDPAAFGIKLLAADGTFARYGVPFEDPTPCDHAMLGRGLQRALYQYMRGLGLDRDVRAWFAREVPRPEVPPDLMASYAGPHGGDGDGLRPPRQPWRRASKGSPDAGGRGLGVSECVVVRDTPHEFALLNLSDGRIHRFEGVGEAIWRCIAAGNDEERTVDQIAAQYDAPRSQIARDVAALVDRLCEEGLLERPYARGDHEDS